MLVYPHDKDAGRRHDLAAHLVAELWETRQAVISTQILQEFHVNATRKMKTPISRPVAREIVETYAAWQTEIIGPGDIPMASELEERHQLSFWDALIVVAALEGGATTILTEDMSPGRVVSAIRLENPFASPR